MRGARPKPTKLKVIEGNPGKRPLPEDEPMPDKAKRMPTAPAHLDKLAKREWVRTGKQLFDLGLLTKLDLPAFEQYCEAYATWKKAIEAVQVDNILLKSATGGMYMNPALHVASQAAKQMKVLLVEFGMTPAARTKLTVEPKKKKEDLWG